MGLDILNQIVADAAGELESRKREVTLSSLESLPGFSRNVLSLEQALRGKEITIIAEIKYRSPSEGPLGQEQSPAAIAAGYERAGAGAISVLTETNHFGGSLENLEAVRRATPSMAVLRKDFVVDPYQIAEARAYGADAVLLIATLLDRNHLAELMEAAAAFGIEALVELYSEHELDMVDPGRVRILGVNNRDLRTFEVDTSRAPSILSRLPETMVTVAESGISSAGQLAATRDAGIDAALIGTSFMRTDDPGQALARLLDQTASIQSIRNKNTPGTPA